MKNDELYTVKQIALYARVSSSNQENEGTIETQLSAIHEFAKKNKYIIIREYLDNGWSGDNIIRPELDKLRVDAKKKQWQAVLIYDPDRLARRYSYQELITDELREAGVEVIFVTTPAPSNGLEKILFGVQGLFAEYERAKIAERFRLGKVRKANEGHVIATEAPYGYTFIPKHGKKGDEDFKQGYYEVNSFEAKIVHSIFNWSASGVPIRGIVKKLQNLNIAPRKSKRGVWNTSTLSTMLRNKTYIGEAHFGASIAAIPINPIKKDAYKKNRKTSRKIKPESEWIKIQVPAIIEPDLFYQVQKQLASNFELSRRNTKNEYLLSGKIWCSCGCRRVGEGALKGKHLYYRCTNRINSFPLPPVCFQKGINAKISDAEVWNMVTTLMTSPKLLLEQAERWIKKQQTNTNTKDNDYTLLKTELKKLKEQEERFVKGFGEGLLSMEQFKNYVVPLRERITQIHEQILKQSPGVTQLVQKVIPDKNFMTAFADKAVNQLSNLNFELKKKIVRDIIDKVICQEKKLTINGCIPYEYLKNVEFFTNDRNSPNTIAKPNSQYEFPFSFSIDLEQINKKL
jgi:site-specific DNA recombinase